MAIYKYLDVSTCHITKNDADMLTKAANSYDFHDPIVYEYREGFFLPIMSGKGERASMLECMDGYREKGYSSAFFKLLHYALNKRVSIIRLDADGDHIADLPENDW